MNIMNSLTITPISFKAQPFKTNTIKKTSSLLKKEKTSSAIKTFSLWNVADKVVTSIVKNKPRADYSTEPLSFWVEKNLEKKGVNVRFKNNLKLAQYTQTGIDFLEEKNLPLPKNIYYVSPILGLLGVRGMTYMLKDKKESPIILPRNIVDTAEVSYKNFTEKKQSSPGLLHIFFHEVGHWLHHQKGFNPIANNVIWQKQNQDEIAQNVSKLAVTSNDGSDFCAEIFAGQMNDIEFSDSLIALAKELNAPLIEQ